MKKGENYKVLLTIVSISLFIFLLVILGYFYKLIDQTNINEDMLFRINKGDSISKVINSLAEKKITKYPKIVNISVRIFRPKLIFKQGEYLLKKDFKLTEIFEKFTHGNVIQRMVLITEGITVRAVKEILEKEDSLTGVITQEISEGFIYPDTYYFESSYDRNKLFKKMHQNMHDFLDSIIKFDDIIKSKEDLLNLASIVEKETKIEEERPMIAAIFLNRLRRNMFLQADPTIIYGLSEGKGYINRNLTYNDLRIDTDFNTYLRKGLPATAISIPSINSIKAVLNPIITDNLYFVANNKGGHCFTNNLLKHNMNVIKYRKNNAYECE